MEALGVYQEFNAYPSGMLEKFGSCTKQFCRGKKAGKNVYKYFVQKSELWNQRHPGDMIYGMAWFEIMYLEKLRTNKKQIERFFDDQYGLKAYASERAKKRDIKALHSLVKMNKGRIKMREALGLSLNDSLAKVLNQHWLLGDFLNNNSLKIKKVKLDPALKKRKDLLTEYKSAVKKYKTKLEDEKEG